jgi:hypothetical protein
MAMDVLKEAEALDGMKPYTATNNHKHGQDEQVIWSDEMPSAEISRLSFANHLKRAIVKTCMPSHSMSRILSVAWHLRFA